MSPTDTPEEAGPELPGLRCVRLLGSGGYADVYLYERDHPKIPVAVKLMKSSLLDDHKRRQFTAEADAMAELAEHPFIVSVLGAGTAPDGRPYLEMQYYPSSDLAERVATQPMLVPEALRYGVQLSSAVETAHRADIIHRDIKPSNILLTSFGQPGLSDFGIAGRPNDADDDSEVGVSLPWSPPEVLSGASSGSVASDVYSLAATVWTLLVGHAPFHLPGGDNSQRATFTRIVHSRPPTTGRGDVPSSLDRLLQQAMAKDPGHRPQSALELARHFQRVEQELRLARTETIVIDQRSAVGPSVAPPVPPAGRAALDVAAGATSIGTWKPAGVDADATQRRALRRTGAVQSPSPTAPAHTAPSGQAATRAFAPPPTTAPPAAAPRRSAANVDEQSASQPTRLRPRTAGTVQDVPGPEPAPRSNKGRLVGAFSAVAVGLVVVVGIIVATSGGTGGRAPGASTNAKTTQQSETNANVAVPDASSAPTDPSTVSGKVAGSNVVFSWPAVAGISDYSWSIGNGPSHTTSAITVTVPRSASGKECIIVHSVAPGYPISPGRQACAG